MAVQTLHARNLSLIFEIEQPCSLSAWQALYRRHAILAERRYLYHAHLLAQGFPEFAPSLAAFQTLTKRHPDALRPQALADLRAVLDGSRTASATRLWKLITQETIHHTFYHDHTNLFDLCSKVASGARILKDQEKPLRSSFEANTAEWQALIAVLALLKEETAASALSIPLVLDDIADLLAPFPDARLWRSLDASQGKLQFRELQLYEAKVGVRTLFSAHESMLIYMTLHNH